MLQEEKGESIRECSFLSQNESNSSMEDRESKEIEKQNPSQPNEEDGSHSEPKLPLFPEDVHKSNSDIEVNIPGGSSSSKSSDKSWSSPGSPLCRICQLGETESDEIVRHSRCDCRGELSRIHRSCLIQWVRQQTSNRCEVCKEIFQDVSPPETPNSTDSQPTNRQFRVGNILVRSGAANLPVIDCKKRIVISILIVLLFTLTAVVSVLSGYADSEMKEIQNNPWSSNDRRDKASMVYIVSISVLLFTGTITIGLTFLWVIVECCNAFRRRSLANRDVIMTSVARV